MINLYQSDVRAMSDETLKELSEELQEAYEINGGDDSYWTDDDAETRYYQMTAEIRRRWDEAHPGQVDAFRGIVSEYVTASLSRLKDQLDLTRAMNGTRGGKVGDTITVANPYRFQA